jgi:hypothetical protein
MSTQPTTTTTTAPVVSAKPHADFVFGPLPESFDQDGIRGAYFFEVPPEAPLKPGEPRTYHLLKFTPDGHVLDCTVRTAKELTAAWAEIKLWFTPETASVEFARGRYYRSGQTVWFSGRAQFKARRGREVTVDYIGSRRGQDLVLDIHSHDTQLDLRGVCFTYLKAV